ncbi:unnamed protein product, partial [Allacma fusca]
PPFISVKLGTPPETRIEKQLKAQGQGRSQPGPANRCNNPARFGPAHFHALNSQSYYHLHSYLGFGSSTFTALIHTD